ncbi:MAG: class I SAM-dependent methyltransferase [Chthoniobacterales bacterium]
MQALLARLSPHDFRSPIIFRIEPATRPRYREIEKCRICGNLDLQPIVSLGEQTLSGIFPRGLQAAPAQGPLELVVCTAAGGHNACGLVQLCQSYDPQEMFGPTYGYRSAQEPSVVRHLQATVAQLLARVPLQAGDLVLDIGSNDDTLLSFYPRENLTAVGFDPAGRIFAGDDRADIQLVPDFFSAEIFRQNFGKRQARIITSIAMLQDLEDPLEFMQEIASILEPEGICHFETNYLPAMVRQNAYDTICHEQLAYYSLRQIKWLTDRSGLKIIAVECNQSHGGSLAVTVARRDSAHPENSAQVADLLRAEESAGLTNVAEQQAFRSAVGQHKTELPWLLHALTSEGRKVIGLGSSTSGNVLLQHCEITVDVLPVIAETDPNKIGCRTPGTNIPIVSDSEARASHPDYLLVLQWHEREEVIRREAEFLALGGKLIFPLPTVEVVG